jgi:cytochrome b subunit of formate dehydrogenase
MFQTVSILVLLATLIGVVVHWFAFPATSECRGGSGAIRGLVHAFSLLLIEQRSSFLGALKKLCYLLAVVCFVVLAFTGFWPVLVRGEHISGYLMMIHATFAPIFAFCLAILAITWASGHRFIAGDCPCVQRLLRRVTRLHLAEPEGPCKCSNTIQKMMFWAIVALALPLILSIVLSMYPLFGTYYQELALAIHRWTSVAFFVVVILHTYLAVRVRMAQ